ncbi:AMP-binding enzyme [Cryptosporidium felis]|nr:AMP-binding enzyme [Cryptosporidium felis]
MDKSNEFSKKNESFIEYWKKNGTEMSKEYISKELFEYSTSILVKNLSNISQLSDIIGDINNSGNMVKVGCFWNGNKIEDLLFREFCFKNRLFTPVILNYSGDNPEITSYKLFITDCQVLLYDVDIPLSFIDEVVTLFSSNYKRNIFPLPSTEIFHKEIFYPSKSITHSEKETFLNINHPLNLEANYLTRPKNVTEEAKNSELMQILEFNSENIGKASSNREYLASKFQVNCNDDKYRKIANNPTLQRNKAQFELDDKVRNIMFTSGSTGKPKGVKLTYNNYLNTMKSLSVLCKNTNTVNSIFIITNPLHHVNSTCFTEYCIRNSIKLVLIHRYSKEYWIILNETIMNAVNDEGDFSIIVPLVPKHFEYFCSMLSSGYFENKEELLLNLSHPSVHYFFGSSAVSRNFLTEFKRVLNGKIPRVRFGSTETCLQLCGTDLFMTDSMVIAGFEGIRKNDSNSTHPNGYFIGRPVKPFAEMSVVKSVDRYSSDFLVQTDEYELGYIICRGNSIMSGYINSDNAFITREEFEKEKGNALNTYQNRLSICDKHPWYIGLGDKGYWAERDFVDKITILKKEFNLFEVNKDRNVINSSNIGECGCCDVVISVDNIFYYWVTRSSASIKIGGVKYSSEEINKRIKDTVIKLNNQINFPDNFLSVVIGIKDDNISEDDKVVFVYETFNGSEMVRETIINKLNACNIPKPYIPHKIIEMTIPLTFKGTVDFDKLTKIIKENER